MVLMLTATLSYDEWSQNTEYRSSGMKTSARRLFRLLFPNSHRSNSKADILVPEFDKVRYGDQIDRPTSEDVVRTIRGNWYPEYDTDPIDGNVCHKRNQYSKNLNQERQP